MTPDPAPALSPFNAGADAELVVFGVDQRNPACSTEAPHVVVETARAERLESPNFGLDLVGDDVRHDRSA
jgi:hypothetical protein